MPNWCSTYVQFVLNDEKNFNKLQDLHDKLEQFLSKPGYSWLADLNTLFDFTNLNPLYPKRGYITDVLPISRDNFSIYQEDAWSPNVSFWKDLVDNIYGVGTFTLFYRAEEPGMAVYLTNIDNLDCQRVQVCAEGLEELKELDRLWAYNGPFMTLLPNDNVYRTRRYDNTTGIVVECEEYISKDELDETLENFVSDTKNLPSTICVNEYEYESIEEMMISDITFNDTIDKIVKQYGFEPQDCQMLRRENNENS